MSASVAQSKVVGTTWVPLENSPVTYMRTGEFTWNAPFGWHGAVRHIYRSHTNPSRYGNQLQKCMVPHVTEWMHRTIAQTKNVNISERDCARYVVKSSKTELISNTKRKDGALVR